MDRLYHVDPRLLASAGVLALPRAPSAGIILAGFKTAADGRGLPRGPSTANVRPQEYWHYHVPPPLSAAELFAPSATDTLTTSRLDTFWNIGEESIDVN